ncbi:MAG TPA: hypothetical protein VE825_11460, partial [Terriglobales bacterium]|nr:hypothetical protein [Terriglobales bacterium]
MKLKTLAVAVALLVAIFLFAQRRVPLAPQSQFKAAVDLTHTISEKSPNWEGTKQSPFQAPVHASFDKNG